jgi:hypothetical protein
VNSLIKDYRSSSKFVPPKVRISPVPPPRNAEYIMFRAIGNDLPPRHALGQSYTNVKFILDNEPKHDGLQTGWVVNKIVNEVEEQRIIALLESYGQYYIHLPVNYEDYVKQPLRYFNFNLNEVDGVTPDVLHSDGLRMLPEKEAVLLFDQFYHNRNLYIMNNNNARNAMIAEGIRLGARWILPFDGNCYLTVGAWRSIKSDIEAKGSVAKYFYTMMQRMQSNEQLFDPNFVPNANEEPQLIFRNDAKERFNTDFRYGRRPKVEMLWRLGVQGEWDKWPRVGLYEVYQPSELSSDFGDETPPAGWVARLFSGNAALEQATNAQSNTIRARGINRSEGVELLLIRTQANASRLIYGYNEDNTLLMDQSSLEEAKTSAKAYGLVAAAIAAGNAALKVGPWSLVSESDGISYSVNDRMIDMARNTTILAMAYSLTGKETYGTAAATNIRKLFLDYSFGIAPLAAFNYLGGKSASNELPHLLDSIRLVEDFLNTEEKDGLREWFSSYLELIEGDAKGVNIYFGRSKLSTCQDLQAAAVASFIKDEVSFINVTSLALGRMLEQENSEGGYNFDSTSADRLQNLVCWLQLASVAERAGINYYSFVSEDAAFSSVKGPLLLAAINWMKLLTKTNAKRDTLLSYIYYSGVAHYYDSSQGDVPSIYDAPPVGVRGSGVPPFWNLAQPKAIFTNN